MAPPTSSAKESTDDTILHRSILANNDQTRTLTSWLSNGIKLPSAGLTSVDDESAESDLQGDEEEDGLGYTAPKPTLQDRQSLSANEKLRKQLLGPQTNGKRGSGSGSKFQPRGGAGKPTASKPRPETVKRALSESDDETKGQLFTAGKNSRTKSSEPVMVSASMGDSPPPTLGQTGNTTPSTKISSSKKRTTSYLDEVLAKRQNKKNKKNKNQKTSPGRFKIEND